MRCGALAHAPYRHQGDRGRGDHPRGDDHHRIDHHGACDPWGPYTHPIRTRDGDAQQIDEYQQHCDAYLQQAEQQFVSQQHFVSQLHFDEALCVPEMKRKMKMKMMSSQWYQMMLMMLMMKLMT